MHNRVIKHLKAVHVMAKSNFSSWFHSSRTTIMLLFVAAFCFVVANNHNQSLKELNYELHFGESVFLLLSNGCSITTTSILFLIAISELPKRIGYQYSLLIRASRVKWLESQIIYCFWMVLGMLALTVVCTLVFVAPSVTPGSDWSETMRTATKTIQENGAAVPIFIRSTFTPLTACLLAMIPMFFFWITMIFIVLLFGLCRLPLVGLMTYAIMLVADVVFMVESISNFPMPIYYATLDNILANAKGLELQRIYEVLLGYCIVIVVLLICMFVSVHKADLYFQAEE